MSTEEIVTYVKAQISYFAAIGKENLEHLARDSRRQDRDFNLGRPEYEGGVTVT